MKIFLGIVIGAVIGFALYKFVGCPTGTCPITSNPYTSTLLCAIAGGIIAGY